MRFSGLFLVLSLLFLGACTAKYDLVGKFQNSNEVFHGKVNHNLSNGTAFITATSQPSGIVCEGDSYVTKAGLTCEGQRGRAELFCDDGRVIDATWRAQSCTMGRGRGRDEYGNRFTFAFGLDKKEAEAYVQKTKEEVKDKPGIANSEAERVAKVAKAAVELQKKQKMASFPSDPVDVKYPVGSMHPDDIAVIIGNANYTEKAQDIPDVTPAYADANGFKKYAMTSLGIMEQNIIDLRDAELTDFVATFGNEVNHKGRLFNWTKSGRSRVYVYYSGHGAPSTEAEGESYLVPSDAKASDIKLTGYKLDTLYDNLAQLPAKSVTVVLEACFSGNSHKGNLISSASPVYMAPKKTDVPDGLTVISAGSQDQIASWEEDKSHGLFTKYFLKGMAGAADEETYGNGDGRVNYRELKVYLDETVSYYAKRYYGRKQQVQISAIDE